MVEVGRSHFGKKDVVPEQNSRGVFVMIPCRSVGINLAAANLGKLNIKPQDHSPTDTQYTQPCIKQMHPCRSLPKASATFCNILKHSWKSHVPEMLQSAANCVFYFGSFHARRT